MSQQLIAWLSGILRGQGSRRLEEFDVKELLNTGDFEEALARSAEEPVLIFKHSTTCPISAAAYRRLSDYLADTPGHPPCYLVKVIESRPVSNEIANQLNVTHQSPQILLLRNQKSAWDASHGAIDGAAIASALRSLRA